MVNIKRFSDLLIAFIVVAMPTLVLADTCPNATIVLQNIQNKILHYKVWTLNMDTPPIGVTAVTFAHADSYARAKVQMVPNCIYTATFKDHSTATAILSQPSYLLHATLNSKPTVWTEASDYQSRLMMSCVANDASLCVFTPTI